ncbi:MAG: hypothetical protein V7725_02390 [Porticoccus sp.]
MKVKRDAFSKYLSSVDNLRKNYFEKLSALMDSYYGALIAANKDIKSNIIKALELSKKQS